MTDPMLPTIRPMSLAELLDRSIRLYRQNFIKFIGIFAIPYIPLMIIQSGLSFFTSTSVLNGINRDSSNPFTPGMVAAGIGSFIFIFIQFILVNGLATAALTRAVANNYAGKPVGILDSYRTLSTSWLRLILALFIVFIMVIILAIWTIIPCVGWFSGPGILFFIGLVVNPLIAPVISLEKLGVLASVRRAWYLARSRFWWLVGCAFVLTLLGQLIVTGPVYLLNFILQSVFSSFPGNMEMQLALTAIIQTLITMSMSLLYIPLQLTVMTVVYFDLRARSEGLDLAMQMSNDTGPENEVINLPEISNKSSIPLITGMDIGRFALLSLAGIAIYALVFSLLFLIGMARTIGRMKILLRWFSLLAVVLVILGPTTLPISASASGLNTVAGLETIGNSPILEDAYWALVQSSRDAMDDLKGLPEEKGKESLAKLIHEWEPINKVEMDGQVIPVDNTYLIKLLNADKPDLDKITGLLDAMLAAHEKYPGRVFSTADIASLNSILLRPEFLWHEKASNPINEWLQKLWDDFNRWLNSILGNEQVTIPVDNVILSVFASIFLIVVLVFVFRTLLLDFMKEAHINSEEDEGNEPLTSEAAFEKAQVLSRGGDYRSAVRYLYLSSLLLMDERGVLRYDRSKTNREYLRSVANSPELARPLEEVIEVFDNVWYGYHSLEEESFRHYSARVEELKERKS